MPHARRSLGEPAARHQCQDALRPVGEDLLGIEVEWPTHRSDDVTARLGAAEIAALSALRTPRGGRVTVEPGGQVELSTAPASGVDGALDALAEDARTVHAALATRGYACADLALDARRPPRRVLELDRYRALESFFAADGTSGAWMMNNTASTQVNLSHSADPARRWSTLNRIAPVLVAAFANSPGVDQHGRRCASLRQAIWWGTDPARTRPVRLDVPPQEAWPEYALAADVILVRRERDVVPLPPGLPFGRWLVDGHELGWPTADDLAYHLSTLFPPVRPRGWLELRVLDAAPEPVRTAACLVVAAACAASAHDEVVAAVPDPTALWAPAIREGVRHPRLARAADALLALARRHLPEVTVDPAHHEAVAEFAERYVARRRTPGDDLPAPADLRECAGGLSAAARRRPRTAPGRP